MVRGDRTHATLPLLKNIYIIDKSSICFEGLQHCDIPYLNQNIQHIVDGTWTYLPWVNIRIISNNKNNRRVLCEKRALENQSKKIVSDDWDEL